MNVTSTFIFDSHFATHHITPQHTATRCSTLQHAATYSIYSYDMNVPSPFTFLKPTRSLPVASGWCDFDPINIHSVDLCQQLRAKCHIGYIPQWMPGSISADSQWTGSTPGGFQEAFRTERTPALARGSRLHWWGEENGISSYFRLDLQGGKPP